MQTNQVNTNMDKIRLTPTTSGRPLETQNTTEGTPSIHVLCILANALADMALSKSIESSPFTQSAFSNLNLLVEGYNTKLSGSEIQDIATINLKNIVSEFRNGNTPLRSDAHDNYIKILQAVKVYEDHINHNLKNSSSSAATTLKVSDVLQNISICPIKTTGSVNTLLALLSSTETQDDRLTAGEEQNTENNNALLASWTSIEINPALEKHAKSIIKDICSINFNSFIMSLWGCTKLLGPGLDINAPVDGIDTERWALKKSKLFIAVGLFVSSLAWHVYFIILPKKPEQTYRHLSLNLQDLLALALASLRDTPLLGDLYT